MADVPPWVSSAREDMAIGGESDLTETTRGAVEGKQFLTQLDVPEFHYSIGATRG